MRVIRGFRSLIFLLPFLAMPLWAFDWPPISPQDLSMTSIPEQPGAPAVVLLREETDDDMNNVHSVYMRIKVLTDAGREYANVEIPYRRRGFGISDISGRTVHADGSIVPFTGKPFDKTVLKSSGLHVNEKSFILPDVQVGSIIDYRYSLRYDDTFVLPPVWDVQTDLFQKSAYFKFIPFQNHGSTVIELKHGVAQGVAWSTLLPTGAQPQIHNLPSQSFATIHQVSYWVDLSMKDIPALVKEPFRAPSSILAWRVYFYYQQNLKADDYWKAEDKYWSNDVSSFVGKGHGVRDAVAKIISASDTPEQKVRKIYAFIETLENQDYIPQRSKQETEVLALKLNKGVEDVLQNRSGSHDDLNRLFVAMVKAAGIPAYMIWVPDRSQEVFVKNFLSTSQFDAEIAIVQLNGKEVYLDPGSKFCPYGDLDWRYSGVGGLREKGNGPEIGVTPEPSYKQAIMTRMANVFINKQGQLDGLVVLNFQGIQAMVRRQEGGRTDAEGRKKMLEDELRSMLPGNSEINLQNSPDWNSTDTPLQAEFHVQCPFAVAAGKHLMIMQHLFQINEKEQFASPQRMNAVYFHYPWQEADEIHITIPADMQIESLAPDETARLKYAFYQVHQKQISPREMFSRRDFIMGQMVTMPQEYKELKEFYDKVKSGDDQPALVKGSQSVATAQ